MDLHLPLWILVTTASIIASGDAVLSDLEHQFILNATSGLQRGQLASWLKEEEPSASDHAQFLMRPPPLSTGFVPIQDGFPAKYYHHRNPDLEDLESHQKRLASLYHHPLGARLDHKPAGPHHHPDHQPLHSAPEVDVMAHLLQKKHDYPGGNGQYGGWDGFPSGFEPAALQAALAAKKGKEAKALFVLMAPLILLAVFGPFLATQAMIPWFAGGGGVATVASGRRRRRSAPHQQAELEQRLRLFLEVQDLLAGAAESQALGRAFLQCPGPQLAQADRCLERVACECADGRSALSAAERRIGHLVLQNVLSNAMISSSMKERIRKGLKSGKNSRGQCKRFWCRTIDNAQEN